MSGHHHPEVLCAGMSALVCVCVAGLEYLRRAGAFQVLMFDDKDVPVNKLFVMKSYKGNYKEIHQHILKMLQLTQGKTDNSECVGIYWDNPEVAGANNCRFAIGLSVPSSDAQLQKLLTNSGYLAVQPEKDLKSMHVTFPFTGMLSVWLGVFRVYSACTAEVKKKKVPMLKDAPVLEITRGKEGVTEFYFLLGHSKEFNKLIS